MRRLENNHESDGTFTVEPLKSLVCQVFAHRLARRHDLAKCQPSVADDMRNTINLQRSVVHLLFNHPTLIQSWITTTSNALTNLHLQHSGPIIVIQ